MIDRLGLAASEGPRRAMRRGPSFVSARYPGHGNGCPCRAVSVIAGVGRVSVESQAARDGEAALPRRREPDLTGLATFTLDAAGRVTSWSVTAEAVFGLPRPPCPGMMSARCC
jgi:hypothetical protein